MKTMAKRLSDLARIGLCFIVAITLAVPYSGTVAHADESPNTLGNTFDLVAFSSDAPASPSSLAEAKAALDTANQNMEAAEQRKDEAQTNLNEAKASYQEADSAHTSAVNAANSAKGQTQAALDEAVKQQDLRLSSVQDEYAAAVKAVQDAEEQKKNAEAAYNNALQRVTTAEQNYKDNVQGTELESSANAVDKASQELEAAKTAYNQAVQAANTAKSELATLQTQYESARDGAAEAAEDVAVKQSALEAAQQAYDNRETDESSELGQAVAQARNALAAAQAKKTAADGALAQAQTARDNAQVKANAAEAAKTKAQQDLDAIDLSNIEQTKNDAANAVESAKGEHQSASGETESPADRDAAQTALDQAKVALEQATKNLEQKQSELQDLREQLAAIQGGGTQNPGDDTNKVLSAKDFFDDQASTNASNEFTSSGVSSFTNSGTAGDATDADFVLKALDIIEQLNTIRAQLGLSSYQVTDTLMAQEILSLNNAAFNSLDFSVYGTAENFGYSSNADWVLSNCASEWFYTGQTVWNNALSTNQYQDPSSYENVDLPENWSTMTADELMAQAPSFYHQVRTYMNIVNPSYSYIGVAANHLEGREYWFGAYFATYSYDDAYTVEGWKSRFQSWMSAQQTASIDSASTITTAATEEELQQQIATAEGEEQTLRAEVAAKQAIHDALAKLVAAYEALDNANNATDRAQELQNQINDENSALNVAIREAVAELETAEEELARLEEEIETEISDRQSDLDDAIEQRDAALNDALKACREAHQEAVDLQVQLERDRDAYESAWRTKSTEHSNLQAVATEKGQARQEKIEALNNAQDSYDAAAAANPDLAAIVGPILQELTDARDALSQVNGDMSSYDDEIKELKADRTKLSSRVQAENEKLTALQAAQQKLANDEVIDPFNGEEFVELNDHVANFQNARSLLSTAASTRSAAQTKVTEAQNNFDAADDALEAAAAAVAKAQADYDRLLNEDGKTEQPQNPQPTPNPAKKEEKATMKTAEGDPQNKPKTEQADEAAEATEQATAAPAAQQTTMLTGPAKKAVEPGIDPIYLIAGAAIVVAAIATIVTAIVRSRRRKAAQQA